MRGSGVRVTQAAPALKSSAKYCCLAVLSTPQRAGLCARTLKSVDLLVQPLEFLCRNIPVSRLSRQIGGYSASACRAVIDLPGNRVPPTRAARRGEPISEFPARQTQRRPY